MISARQAVVISTTNAAQIESDLDKNSSFWQTINEALVLAMHKGQRKAIIPIVPCKELADIYTVLRYNGYKLEFTLWIVDVTAPLNNQGGTLTYLNYDVEPTGDEFNSSYSLEISW